MLAQHLETDTDSPGPYWDKKEQLVSVHVPLMTETAVSHNPGIPAFEGNSASCARLMVVETCHWS